jgi:hypothetical protein
MPDDTSEIFLAEGLDTPNQFDSADEFRFFVRVFFAAFWRSRRHQFREIELICPTGQSAA